MKKRRRFARIALIFICIAMLSTVTVFAASQGFDDPSAAYPGTDTSDPKSVVNAVKENTPAALEIQLVSYSVRAHKFDASGSYSLLVNGDGFSTSLSGNTTETDSYTGKSKHLTSNASFTVKLVQSDGNYYFKGSFNANLKNNTNNSSFSGSGSTRSTDLWISTNDAGYISIYFPDSTHESGSEYECYAYLRFRIVGVIADYERAQSVVSGYAPSEAGETSVSVPAAIVVGILSAGSALAAAAGLSSGKEVDINSETDADGSRYKMFINKDFGDRIRYDSEPVYIWARMAEIKSDGTEVDRPDLTAQIDISSDVNIEVSNPVTANGYRGCGLHCTSKNVATDPTEGVVSFRFTGKGGTFQNNMKFRLIGMPAVVLEGEYAKTKTVELYTGETNPVDVPFSIINFFAAETQVTATASDALITATVEPIIEPTAEPMGDCRYILHILTGINKDADLTKEYTFSVDINAANTDEIAAERLTLKVHPRGVVLSTDNVFLFVNEEFYDLAYKTVGCGDNPQINFTCESGLVTVDLAEGFEEGNRFLRLKPADSAKTWDKKSFYNGVPCKVEVQYGEGEVQTVPTPFTVTLCYEGIGVAVKGEPVNKLSPEFAIPCYTDVKKNETAATVVPLTVMRWNKEKRALEANAAEINALIIETKLTETQTFAPGTEAYSTQSKAIANAKIAKHPATKTRSDTDASLYPVNFEFYGEREMDPNIPITVTVTSETDGVEPLVLQAMSANVYDFAAMVRWYFHRFENTFIGKYINLGDVNIYLGALKFINNHVYKYSACPFKPRKNQNHYEEGGNTAENWDDYIENFRKRHPSVILRDECFPTDTSDFKKVQSLVHELTHAIEHQHGDNVDVSACERHTECLEYMANVCEAMTDLEHGTGTASIAASNVITEYHKALESSLTGTCSFNWFGSNDPMPPYMFFNIMGSLPAYCDGTGISQANAEKFAERINAVYFPGNCKGKYVESGGIFSGAEWTFRWTLGMISTRNVILTHPKYKLEVESFKPYVFGGRLELVMIIKVYDKATGNTDVVEAAFDGGEVNRTTYKYGIVNAFDITWKPCRSLTNSVLTPQMTNGTVKSRATRSTT